MCLSEVMEVLASRGVSVNESRIRWAIRNARVSRPQYDRLRRFDFSTANVDELVRHFSAKSGVPSHA